ncbi:CAP domain-containing protein [Dactylonectria estremocensis]|uniref:CAP domain-containing protein n=1 Tax=Dactylonectria estremocensis TaxID=1079267 RepID=A0A9P9IMZ2_9HYPO|nr:CAP domain-containing protein [Dactylonectria estremocensis]
MKASLFLAGASAILASAGPINKRAMETEWVYEIVTETVTVDAPVQAQATEVVYEEVKPKTTSVPAVVYTTVVVPAVAETTSTSEVAQAAPTTVWVDSYDEATTSTSIKKTSTKTTKAAAVETTAASDATLNLSLDEEYQTVMLNYHNIHRANHSVDALEWDATYASYAQTIANTCVFAHDMDQGTADYGQNIASWGSTGDISDLQNKCGAQSVTNQWYNSEMDNWSYYGQENPPSSLDLDLYGHFTQVVWKDTTKLGCATALCAAGTMYDFEAWYTVCNYNPQGNYGGEYGKNVLSPLGEKMVTV